ncbi:hypothetical protein RRF57_011259 [Xylaria bambusicola]|uniref:Uncharacterized protein n=1 Tax=Xylaria bambusicola TaxID=326684 RepID=A0AAN7UTI8_9PEZI
MDHEHRDSETPTRTNERLLPDRGFIPVGFEALPTAKLHYSQYLDTVATLILCKLYNIRNFCIATVLQRFGYNVRVSLLKSCLKVAYKGVCESARRAGANHEMARRNRSEAVEANRSQAFK